MSSVNDQIRVGFERAVDGGERESHRQGLTTLADRVVQRLSCTTGLETSV